jgi:ornithine carbamoyltransferase
MLTRSLMVISAKLGMHFHHCIAQELWPDDELKNLWKTFAKESGSVPSAIHRQMWYHEASKGGRCDPTPMSGSPWVREALKAERG